MPKAYRRAFYIVLLMERKEVLPFRNEPGFAIGHKLLLLFFAKIFYICGPF